MKGKFFSAKPWLAASLILLAAASIASAGEWFSGKVVSIKDGDTVGIMRDGREVTVRLDGIDCPESGQDYGTRAKQYCSDLIYGRIVNVEVRDIDKYGRTVGRVFVDGKDVSLELVRAGLAWHYVEYSNDLNLADAQVEASESNIGLWSRDDQIAPWIFRNPARAETDPGEDFVSTQGFSSSVEVAQTSVQPEDEEGLVYVTTSGRKYHSEGCRYLAKSKIPMSLVGARVAGYQPCSVCGGTATPIEADGTAAALSSLSDPEDVDASSRDEATVYITKSGSKYHSAGCRYLSKSMIPIAITDAVARGYGACSVCGPGAPSTTVKSAPSYPPSSSGTVHVKGYYRKDGTYVRPHTRSKPGTKRK